MKHSSKPLIYLASGSPRRSALLVQIGVEHRVRAVEVDEHPLAGEQPARYVERLATQKAQTLWHRLAPAERLPVLGADTAVVIDGTILGKPEDEADCRRMLRMLSGCTHQVFTAVALCSPGGCYSRLSVSEVTFRPLAADEIAAYWRSGEPADKAGGYAVQGLAALFIERIAGSYSGIMGLPLFETSELLGALGWGLGAPASVVSGQSLNEVRG
jgi:nucleoside triphosphate pyrophosphatase